VSSLAKQHRKEKRKTAKGVQSRSNGSWRRVCECV